MYVLYYRVIKRLTGERLLLRLRERLRSIVITVIRNRSRGRSNNYNIVLPCITVGPIYRSINCVPADLLLAH